MTAGSALMTRGFVVDVEEGVLESDEGVVASAVAPVADN